MRINEKTITIRNLEIDEKDFKGFVKYLNDFYGKKGVYPNKFGKDLQPRDIIKAIDNVAKSKPKHQWDWDSLDRELVRDELIDMRVFDYPTQEAALKEISQVGALYEEVEISKDEMEKLHKDGEVEVDGEKVSYEESINEADVVGKTIFSDGKGKLFFGYYKTDDGVEFVDYKTWKGLSFKDVSKGDTNKERVIKAILKGQKQFNKKVEFNMWAKQKKRTFEETMDWFIQNGWINNINKGGIKESVDVLSVNESVNESKESDIIDSFIKDLDNTREIYGAGSSDWGSDRIADITIELKGTKNSYHRKHGSLYDTFDLDLRKVKPVITQLAKKHNLKIVGRVYIPKKYSWKDEFNSQQSGYEHNRVSFSVQIPIVNESVNEYDEWRNTRIQAKNIFRMLKQKYNNNISKMKDGLEDILKQNKTKNDQAEVVRQEFNKYFKLKEASINEARKLKIGKEDFSPLLKLTDKELVKLLNSIRKQQPINYKQYMAAKSKGQDTSKIEKEAESFQTLEKAVIAARDMINFESVNESVNEAFKHIIQVDTPNQIVSKKIASQIMALAKKGVRSKEIGLELGFTGNTKLATDTFQKVKNRIYFDLDKRESVNEATSSMSKEIASMTGTRQPAVQQFIDKHNINGLKLAMYLNKQGLRGRMDFTTALSGKPGNPAQNKIIKMFQESVNEETTFTATNKETGNISVFKTKSARDAAVKNGSHEMKKGDKVGGVEKPKLKFSK